MHKGIWALLVAAGLMLAAPPPTFAGQTGVYIGVRSGGGHHGHWGHRGYGGHHRAYWGPRFYIGVPLPGPWYPYGYYRPPAVVVQPPPRVYAAPERPAPEDYWYYCRNPEGYYPYVETCPGGWMQVVPDAVPPDR
jgi:hypothetical protein